MRPWQPQHRFHSAVELQQVRCELTLMVLKEARHASGFGHGLVSNSPLFRGHCLRLAIGLVQVGPHVRSGTGPQLFSLPFVVVEEREGAAQVTLGASTTVVIVEVLADPARDDVGTEHRNVDSRT
jgi:hypothetical protein